MKRNMTSSPRILCILSLVTHIIADFPSEQSDDRIILLFSLYSQPAFYTRYIVYTASLLIATCKEIFGQKHRCVKVDIAKTTQASHKMRGSANRQARFHHGPDHKLNM